MLYFCTLFDAGYLDRGLANYQSLIETGCDFHLYVFAFDDAALNVLKKMNLPKMTVVSLQEFEDEALLQVKPTRSRGEYCWTCTGSTIRYVLQHYETPHCIYIDADLWFYSNPKVLIEEMPEGANVLITEHRYTPQYNKSKESGIYCVQFMYFDATENGLHILNWWRDRCLEWCYNRLEDGKFGDQKYLDDWTRRFKGVHVLKNPGGGMAPWNIQQYGLEKSETGELTGVIYNKAEIGKSFQPVFYHFHGLKLYENGKAILAPKMYLINKKVREWLYEPYIARLKAAKAAVVKVEPDLALSGILPADQYGKDKNKGWGSWLKTNFLNS